MNGEHGGTPRPDEAVVAIFRTDDPGLLPLATLALDAEGIAYSVRSAGKADTMQWAMSQQPTNRPVVMEIVVGRDAAARARDLLADLDQPAARAVSGSGAIAEAADPPAIRLEHVDTGIAIGAITEGQLQELSSHLEEDAPQQYYVTAGTIGRLQDAHADARLIDLLRRALGNTEGVAVRWTV